MQSSIPTDGLAGDGSWHRAFGLVWRTAFPMPELSVCEPAPSADVTVTLETIPLRKRTRAAPDSRGPSSLFMRFDRPGVAKLEIRGGSEIAVDPDPGADPLQVRIVVAGIGAALLLLQRGMLPLHATVISAPTGAVLFSGHSGAGKSTTLNEFLQRGYRMVAEDLAALRVDDHGTVWVEPGVAVTRLRADSAAAFGTDTRGLARVHPDYDKFVVPVDDARRIHTAVPVTTIYSLSAHAGHDITLQPLKDARRLHAVLNQVWQKTSARRMGLHETNFRQAAAIASRIRIVEVQRPAEGFRLRELADALESDFLGLPDRELTPHTR